MVAFFVAIFPVQAFGFTGIDISSHNEYINFQKVKDDGVKAIIIKATEGVDYVDSRMEQYYNGAKSQGIQLGFYHFMSERTDPSQQAIDFYNAIRDKEYQITPVLDIENNSYNRSSYEVTNRCLEFLQKFKELSGEDCTIYTGGYFGLDTLDYRIKTYKAWIAHYGVSSPMPTGFFNVVAHQYSESGNVNGINGLVDMDNFNDGIFLNSVTIPVSSPAITSTDDSIYIQLQQELNRQGFGNLNEDGIPGPLTLNSCPTIREGARGIITQWVQLRVGAEPDGVFGQDTKSAVKYFQSHHGLRGDGVVGRNTWKVLLGI